jgi:hypothetical protein
MDNEWNKIGFPIEDSSDLIEMTFCIDFNRNHPKITYYIMRKIIAISAVILSMFFIYSCKKNKDSYITDSDKNVYSSVTIGTQVWMKENLRTTRYNNGESIPLVTNFANWADLSTPGYCCIIMITRQVKRHMVHCTIGMQ